MTMKDIKDYFASPTKTNPSTGSETPKKSPMLSLKNPQKHENPSDIQKNNKAKVKDNKKALSSSEKSKKLLSRSPSNVENDEKLSNSENKQKRKSNSKLQLKLKTSSSSNESNNSAQHSESSKSSDSIMKTENTPSQLINDSQNSRSSSDKPKVNAFQFLMDSRNNVIGQNSDGREADLSSQKEENYQEKNTLEKRKHFLQEWSEKKGSAKRKIEEVEIDNCISKKMDKRAKRLKNMLQGENSNSQEDDDFCVKKKKKKRIVRITSSDSESSRSSVKKNDTNNEKSNENYVLVIHEENAQDTVFSETKSKSNKNAKKPCSVLENEQLRTRKETSKKRSRLSCLDNFCKPQDESSQDSQDATPRTLRKWSLRIKLSENHPNNKEKQSEMVSKKDKKQNAEINVEECEDVVLINDKNVQKDSNTDSLSITLDSSDSEEDTPLSELVKKSVKLAPIFGKAKKLDEKSLEARRHFLLSGVPDKLKKKVQKQKKIEEQCHHNVFPTVSHVQQKCDHNFWNLPDIELNLTTINLPINTTNLEFKNFNEKTTNISSDASKLNFSKEVQKVKNLKATLNKIKEDNPDYPVFKAFRHIYEKSGKANTAQTKKKERKKSKKEVAAELKEDVCTKEHDMWSEKYKARCSDEILGNHTGVTKLKNWLEIWMNYSEEINSRRKEKACYDSGSEFDTTDCDSRDSARLPGNTVIVGGPNGSGKTSAIYAIANELGFNVLEINSSSKRTGKKLQQELQEATQSHQVRKKEIKSIFNIKKSESSKKTLTKNNENLEKENKKMCILLVEDVDVIFDQDEGFLASICQLITTSKRPIILTTSDTTPSHIQKLLTQHEYISFSPLSLYTLSVWLQLVCLVEGLLVCQYDLGNLLEYNKGDIRKTLLEVQFWTQSGGQINSNDVIPILTKDTSRNWEKTTIKDERIVDISFSEDCNSKTDNNNLIHKNILGSFEVFKGNKPYNIPLDINLGTLWWNTPNIFNIHVPQRRFNDKKTNVEDMKQSGDSKTHNMNKVLRYYDSLVATDILHTSLGHCSSMEPILTDWSVEVRNSLELGERMEEKSSLELVDEMTHFLIDGCINHFKTDGNFEGINMALPDSTERRWRATQHICEDFLKEPIPLINNVERRNVTLDYLPALRSIARSEKFRSTLNTKRGNRFRHYFRNLNMDFNDNVCKMVSNILVMED